jgi:hypothetical protein
VYEQFRVIEINPVGVNRIYGKYLRYFVSYDFKSIGLKLMIKCVLAVFEKGEYLCHSVNKCIA